MLQKKEHAIINALSTAKNNPKFEKLINYSLTSLESLISPDNSEKYINIYSIMKLGGIKTLTNIASVNFQNDELINKTTDIMNRFLKYDDPKNHELSKFFVEQSGHMDIFQLLVTIKSEEGIKSLLDIVYKLVQVPQLVNILLDSGLVDTLQFLSDRNKNNVEINDFINKINTKITNHRKGRDLLLNNKFVNDINSYIELNLESNNRECIFNGLMILDNFCKSEKGKGIIKELNTYKILGNALWKCFNDGQITHKIIKIFSKIVTINDIDEKLRKIKKIGDYLINNNDIGQSMNELNEIFNFISNFMIVQDTGKALCSLDNMKTIIDLFNILYSIDLQDKNKEFLINYLTLIKYFMIIFKRLIEYDPEYLDENNNKGKLFVPIINKILDCVKKNWEGILPIFQTEEKDEIIQCFKNFFSAYCEIFVEIYNKVFMDNNNEIIPLIEYILDKIILNVKNYFYNDEIINYHFSLLLKLINQIIIRNKSNIDNLNDYLIKCFPYFKEIINKSENWITLSNLLDLIYTLIKNNNNNIQIIENIIPIITNFMIQKPKYRYPNLVNLKILDNYLTPEFTSVYISIKKNRNENNDLIDNNPNYKLDYVYAICSVMVKGFYDISLQDKEKKENNNMNIYENKYINEFKEEKNKETEKKILIEGGKLLKRLISPEEFLEKVNLLKHLVKEYVPGKTTQENIEILQDNIIFQICALNMNEYLSKGMEDDFKCIKDLIIKEINFIEYYKRENAKKKQINEEYKEVCKKSTKMLKIGMTALRKIEDGAIINYTKHNDEKYIDLLKQIITLNIEIIDKSTDAENQMSHLKQLRKNASFLYNNQVVLKTSGQSIIELFINSLINLLRKNINEELCYSIIETIIVFSNYNKEIYNLLVKGGCPKLILQFLLLINSNKLCYDAIQLLKNICLSKQENLMILANQNILITLFEIRTKFINDQKITQSIDQIVNEVMKLPNQGIHVEEILMDAIKDFHENMKHKFEDDKTKFKLLSDLIIINSYITNKTQIKNLLSQKEFIQDFNNCVKKTLESKESSQMIERLFMCEVELIKKLKDHIPVNEGESEDQLHHNFCNSLLKILFHPSIFSESFLLTANTLLYYIKDNLLYSKYLVNKINEKFIEQLLEQEENYIDNPYISKVINNILSYLALKDPKFAKYIVMKGGLVNIIDDLKTLVNLNDENSIQIKCNGLIMIDSLLNDEKNMEIFIQSNGIELINNIIKNEIKLKHKKDNEIVTLEEQYKAICCINCNTTHKIKPKENNNANNKKSPKKDRRRSSNITTDVIIRETTGKSSKYLSLLSNNDINYDNNNNNEDNNENLDDVDYDNNNYILYCMQIINKGLSKNKKEFIDKNTIDNFMKIAENNFPDKFIFSQFSEFISYYLKNQEIINQDNNNNIIENNEKNFGQNKNIIKFALSNRAFFYSNTNIVEKAKDIENQIGALIFEKNEYISDYKSVLSEKYEDDDNLEYKLLTYLSLVIELPLFKKVFDEIKNEIVNFFNQVLLLFLSSEKNLNQNNIIINNNNVAQDKNNNNSKKREGILLSLMKLYNYFLEKNIIDKKDPKILQNISSFEKIGIISYSPSNYLFVYEFEKEITKLIEQTTGFILEEKKEKDTKMIKYTKNYYIHLQNIFNKVICFVEDFCKTLKSQNFIDNQSINIKKEDNLDNILILVIKYLKTNDDLEKKEESSQILVDTFINMLQILFEEEIYEIYTKNNDRISNKLKLLWKLIYYSLYNDNKNKVLEKISINIVSYLIIKLKATMKIKQNNKPSLRKIPLIMAKRIENNNDINQIIYEFVVEDINKYGKNNEKIKKIDLEILSYLSKLIPIIKQIIGNKVLWKYLKDEYSKNNLSNDERLYLAIIFRNATKNKANLEEIIKSDLNCIQIIFSKVLKDTITSLENNGKIIAETEIESVCNIIKNKNHLAIIEQKNIVNHEELKKIANIYDSLDENICKSFKPILNEIAVDDKLIKNLQSIHEDEEKLKELEQIVLTNYEKHVLEFIKFFDKNKKEESLLDSIVKDELLMDGKKKIIGEKDLEEEKKNKEKIKTPLSVKKNEKMSPVLTQILLILIKNYNVLNSFKEDIYNVQRILIINKTLNLIQKISLSKDNHENILEDGLLNLLEKMCEDYKNEKLKGINKDDNNYLTNFITKGKFILKECSQSDNTCNIILDSPIFPNIVSEIIDFNDNPKLININSNTKKIFIYDTAVITNVCMISKAYEQIINKLGINTIIKLGTKTGNIILLENIINMIIYFISIIAKKKDLKLNDDFYDVILAIMEKCIRNKNRSSILMVKILNLACLLYNPNNRQKVDKLKLLESINQDIEIFSIDEDYLSSALNCLRILIKNNPQNIESCFEIKLVKTIKKTIKELAKESPGKYVKIYCKLTEFYYYLIKNNPENCSKMCENEITTNIVKYIDMFNNLIEPKSEQEKEIEIKQNQLELLNDDSVKNDNLINKNKDNNQIDNNENILNDELYETFSFNSNQLINKKPPKVNYIRKIMMNCINFLDKITKIQDLNKDISAKTSFNKTIITSIKNENNDNSYLIVALHCLGNYLHSEAGITFLKLKIIDIYSLLKNLQSKYYSNAGILININYISGAIIMNCEDKNHSKLFFDLVADSIKCQDWNSNLIKMALKIMNDSLEKKPFMVDVVNEQLISNITNILKLYKEDYEIQLNCYKLLSIFANDEHILAFSSIINELLQQIRQSLSNILKDKKEDKKNKEKIKNTIFNLILFLGNINQYSENIINEIIIPFIKELNDFGIDEETNGPFIINIFDNLFKNSKYIEPFLMNKGMDSLIIVLKMIDNKFNRVNIILRLFSILIGILKVNDENKIMMQNLKMEDIINRIIKLTSYLDKRIEFEGRSLLFLISRAKKQLEKVEEVDYTEIKIIEPIKSEVRNYLTSGRQLKLINEHGEVKEKQLLFTRDLLKVQAKLIKSNLPPKPKYVIETNNIKAIIKGHGTDAFKKSGGLFRSVPKPELCFSIIGPKTEDGLTKALNVVCKNEKEANRWIDYMESVIIFFQKKKYLGNVEIKKNL